MNSNPYAPPSAGVSDLRDGTAAPALWNPNAAASWSLLFSPAFGAYLQMRNWQALGEEAKAQVSRNWVIATIVLTIAAGALSVLLPETNPVQKLTNRFGVIMLLTWYFANGRAQPAFVKERYGKDYPRKNWGQPIGIAFLVVLVFLFFIVALAMLSGAAD